MRCVFLLFGTCGDVKPQALLPAGRSKSLSLTQLQTENVLLVPIVVVLLLLMSTTLCVMPRRSDARRETSALLAVVVVAARLSPRVRARAHRRRIRLHWGIRGSLIQRPRRVRLFVLAQIHTDVVAVGHDDYLHATLPR